MKTILSPLPIGPKKNGQEVTQDSVAVSMGEIVRRKLCLTLVNDVSVKTISKLQKHCENSDQADP